MLHVATARSAEPPAQVVVYYFHATIRCESCLYIEAVIDTTLRERYPEALASGRLLWQPLDTDLDEHRHFVKDFDLPTNSVVIARLRDSRLLDWHRVENLWELSSATETLRRQIDESVGQALQQP